MYTSPVSFSFHESHDVRIQVIDGEPWFCLKDVYDVLDIKNVSQISMQPDEKDICKAYPIQKAVNDSTQDTRQNAEPLSNQQ